MNKRAQTLLADLIAAGAVPPPFIVPVPSVTRHVRRGYIAQTDETEKAEIAGLPCIVKSETETEARVFVQIDGRLCGPFRLKPSEITTSEVTK